jgi:hypothetical protein
MEARPLIRRPDRCETNLSIDAGAGHDDFLFEEGPDNVAHHAARYGDALDLPPRSSNLNVPELRIFGVRFEQRALHLHDRHLRGGRQPSRRRVGRIRRNQSPPDQSLRWHELVAGHSQRDAPLTRYRAGPPRRAYSMAVRIVTAGSHTENGIAEVQFRDTVNGAKLAIVARPAHRATSAQATNPVSPSTAMPAPPGSRARASALAGGLATRSPRRRRSVRYR